MAGTPKNRGRILLGLAIGGAFLAFAVWGVPLGELRQALTGLDATALGAVAALTILQQGLRAWRQAILLEPIAPGIPFRRQLLMFLLGFLGIATLPARLGELVRPVLLRRQEGLPMGRGLGFVVTERMLDMVVLLAALAWALGHVDASTAAGRMGASVRPFVALAVPFAIAGLAVAVWWGQPLTRRWLAPEGREPGRLRKALSHFVQALSAQRSAGRLAAGLAITVAHFACMAFSVAVVAEALGLGDSIGPLESLGILCLTMLGLALPTPPGQVGVFEGSVVASLSVFGIGQEQGALALAFALVIHWWPLAVHSAATAALAVWDREGTRGLLGELREASAGESGGSGRESETPG